MGLKANSVRGLKELSNIRQKHPDESAMMHYGCSDGDYSCKWRKARLLRLIPEVRLEFLRQRGRQTSTCSLGSSGSSTGSWARRLPALTGQERGFFFQALIFSVEGLGWSMNNAARGCLLSIAWIVCGWSCWWAGQALQHGYILGWCLLLLWFSPIPGRSDQKMMDASHPSLANMAALMSDHSWSPRLV